MLLPSCPKVTSIIFRKRRFTKKTNSFHLTLLTKVEKESSYEEMLMMRSVEKDLI